MAHNKFFLSSFFVIYCLTLFFMGKTSLASTPTVEELTQFIDVIKTKQSNGELNNSSYTLINGNSSHIAESLYNSTQDINYNLDNLIYVSGRQDALSDIDGYFVIANNTFSNELDYLGLRYSSNYLYNDKISDNLTNLGTMPMYIIPNGKSSVSKVTKYNSAGTSGMTNIIFNFDKNNLTLTNNMIFTTQKTASIYWYSGGEYFGALNNYNGQTYYDFYPKPEPEEPSGDSPGIGTGTTGTITNSSGDTTGKVDLSGIESGIGNINQNIDKTNQKLDGISGEIGKLNENLTTVPSLSGENITSGEITGALNFDFAEDPYANFWLELTTGLGGALTNNVRSIDVQFRGQTYKIELDKFAIQTPDFLRSFLAILSTVFIFWKMIKYWKIIINKITSGNMDEVLEMNEEEGIINLF